MTSKPLSTISYNSKDFAISVLNDLMKEHLIQTYMLICHKGEDGDKDHIHLRIEPNKKLDPMSIGDLFIEPDPFSDKPKRCRTWRPSKEEDWFLYAVHDSDYLKLKYGGGEKGEKLPYKWQDIIVPDNYDSEIAFIRARASLNHTTANMAKRIASGDSQLDLILEGENVFQVNGVYKSFISTDYDRLNRSYLELSERFINLENELASKGIIFSFDDSGSCFVQVRPHE